MVLINIHLESFDRKSFESIKKLARKGPIAISFAPIQIPLIKKYQVRYFKNLFKHKDYVLGQQGLTHECKKCIAYRKKNKVNVGPHHENYCLRFGEVPAKEQEKFMMQGRRKIKKLFGREPELYVPPNHLFGKNTVAVVKKLKYKWMTDKAYFSLGPYISGEVLIVPESKSDIKKSNQIYAHDAGEIKSIDKKLISFYDVKPSKIDKKKIEKNRKLKIVSKIQRDLIKAKGIEEDESQRLAESIYNLKFADSSVY
ncbi:MAG: hypothetical protein ABIA78_02080 [archaeon]